MSGQDRRSGEATGAAARGRLARVAGLSPALTLAALVPAPSAHAQEPQAQPAPEQAAPDEPATEAPPPATPDDDAGTAEASSDILVQLNNLQPIEAGGCRVTVLATNDRPDPIERLGVELVVFDAERRVDRFLMLEFTRLAVGKTKVSQFDLAERPCEEVSQLLVNDVVNCGIPDGELPSCAERVRLENLTDIDLAF